MARPFHADVVIEAPFEIRQYHFTLKPENRTAPEFGQAIAVPSDETFALKPVIDGRGLGNKDEDPLLEHNTGKQAMWIGETDSVTDGLVFDLGGPRMLETIAVWNYNQPAYTDMGIAKADIAVWTEADGWKTILKAAALQEAEGTTDYDEPTVLTFKPVTAEKVRFGNLTAFDPEAKQVGVSEICFYEPLGPAACNPAPADGAAVSCGETVALAWTAGKQAIAHDVYLGESEATLTHLGRIKGASAVTLGGLNAGTDYCWRIDEVAKDGTVQAGPVWSVKVDGQQICRWPLDETVDDAMGTAGGVILGEPAWQAGHDGQAIELDGEDDCVEIPALNLNTDTLTICAWIKSQSQTAQVPPVVLCRTEQTVAGLNMIGDSLRYHWNDLARTYGWDSGLTVPTDRWVFVAVTVAPAKATLYLYDQGELKSAENPMVHTVEEFDGPLYLGSDPEEGRYFKGCIDDVGIYDYALSRADIEKLAQGQPLAAGGIVDIRLVDAQVVAADESLEAIAAEIEPGRPQNLLAVGRIVLAALGFAGVSVLRKKR